MSLYHAFFALTGSIIDYAGTFAPASLSLDDSLKKAFHFRKSSKHPWIFGKMALTMPHLKELSAARLLEAGADGNACLFTAIGSFPEGGKAEDFLAKIEWDLRELRRLEDRWFYSSIRQSVVCYETRLPASWSLTADDDSRQLIQALERFRILSRGRLDLFLELDSSQLAKVGVSGLLKTVTQWQEQSDEDSSFDIGIKLRTGGKSVPSLTVLATAISEASSYGISVKATQGLHECYSHGNDYGFINLFASLAFSFSLGQGGFTSKNIEDCLKSPGSAFSFTKESLRWGEFQLSAEQIETARRVHRATFGSCSLDEPEASILKENL